MNNIPGIEIIQFPFNLLTEVGTLLSNHYPTTIIFSDQEANPIIKEWVDTTDDNKVDRFFFYKTSKLNLKKFIDGEISHIDLINSSKSQYVVFQDITIDDDIVKITISSLSEIPLNYKPSNDFFFHSKDGVDVEDIKKYFDLDNLEINDNFLYEVRKIAEYNKSETIYIHLKRGKGVGAGNINTEVFGKTLLNFDNLYKNLALDHVLGITRGDISLDAKKNADYLQFTETSLYGERIAASYGFLLRPITTQFDLFGATQSEKIAEIAFNLISKSQTVESLKEEYLLHSGFTLESFKQFLEGIQRFEMKLDLNWFNPINKKEFYEDLDYIKANRIIFDIDNLAITDENEFTEKGKFRAVNCDTRHYHFTSLGEQQYTGYFDKPLKDGLVLITFLDIYEVKVSRRTIKEAGKKEARVVDTIIAYYIDKV